MGWAGVGIGAIHGVAIALARRRALKTRRAPPPVDEIIAALRPSARLLLGPPLVAALAIPSVESEHPAQTFFWVAILAVLAGTSTYRWRSHYHRTPHIVEREAVARVGAIASLGLLWVAYAAAFSYLSILNHHALQTSTRDLGIYDNIFYQSAHGRPLACSLISTGYHGAAHFDPFLLLLAPLYRLYPRAEFLLVLQSVWLGAGVVPVYLLAHRELESRPLAYAVAAMYAVYPALHGVNLYDFHSLALLTPVTLWLIYSLERGALRAYWILLAGALLIREDVSLLMCFVGVYEIMAKRPGWTRIGWITILISLVYFTIAKRCFMTSADIFNSGAQGSYSFAYYYDALIPAHNGVFGLVASLLTNPVFVLRDLLAAPKVLYVLTIFVPLLFLPFVARPGRVMLGWGLLFSLLASRPAVYSVHFQYSSFTIPIAFALFPAGLRRLDAAVLARGLALDGSRLRRSLVVAACVSSLLVCWKFGGIVANQSFRGGFKPVARRMDDDARRAYEWLTRAAGSIPLAASVGLTDRTGPHASNRERAFVYPEHHNVEWLLIDEADLTAEESQAHAKNVDAGLFALRSRQGSLALYQRR